MDPTVDLGGERVAVVDVFAVCGLVFNDAVRVGEVWLAFLAAQMLMALYAFHLDKERPTALWTMELQQAEMAADAAARGSGDLGAGRCRLSRWSRGRRWPLMAPVRGPP